TPRRASTAVGPSPYRRATFLAATTAIPERSYRNRYLALLGISEPVPHRDRNVEAHDCEALPALAPAVRDDEPDRDHSDRHADELLPAKGQRESGLDEEGEDHHCRCDEERHLGARGDRDLARELELAARGDDDCAAVLGGVSDDRDDDRRDEELRQADRVPERVERVDEDLGDERG